MAREIRIVLQDVSDPEGPPEFLFVEVEDKDGRGVADFRIVDSGTPPLKEIVLMVVDPGHELTDREASEEKVHGALREWLPDAPIGAKIEIEVVDPAENGTGATFIVSSSSPRTFTCRRGS